MNKYVVWVAGLLTLSGCSNVADTNQSADRERSEVRTEPRSQSPSQDASEVHYSDVWTEMKENPSSANLASYIEVAEPIDQKIGNAGAVLKCGIQSVAWYSEVTRKLEEYRAGPAVAPIYGRLTQEERRQAQNFDRAVTDGQMQMSGGNFDRESCESLARMPFAYSAAAFEPGPYRAP